MEVRTTDLYRPTYHFQPPANWMNDPNGPLYFGGCYHLFYQYNPSADCWGSIHWGHARSADLLHWEHLPTALAPSREQGEEHCFSGCAAVENGLPVILYTSVGSGTRNARYGSEQWAAVSRDAMTTWEKYRGNPVLKQDGSKGPEFTEWRDPFVRRVRGGWELLLGGQAAGYGCVALYRGHDLFHWKFCGILFQSDDAPFLECPNLLSLNGTEVLLYSAGESVSYHIGFPDARGRFHTNARGILDRGGATFYAANTLLGDAAGRSLTWGWLREDCGGELHKGWSGMLSLPRVLSVKDGELFQEPAEEYRALREREIVLPAERLQNETAAFEYRGRAYELLVEADADRGDDFSVLLLASADGRECTRVRYIAETRALTLERGLSSMAGDTNRSFFRMTVPAADAKISLRIFVDHSCIEIFANRREAMTGRVYPTLPDSDGVSICGTVKRISARLWPLTSAVK